MPHSSFPIDRFGGLDLRFDPLDVGSTGALDMLNASLAKPGRVRCRDGYALFATSSQASALNGLAPMYTNAGSSTLVGHSGSGYFAYNTSGTEIATSLNATGGLPHWARIGTTSAEYLYGADGAITPRRWTGAAFSSVSLAGGIPYTIAAKSDSSRLAAAGVTNIHRVDFSDRGAPETFGANNWEELTPGDGERVEALVTYRDLLFAFKNSKFFVFYGEGLDPDGEPLFNYRTVDVGVGLVSKNAWTVAPDGVYFLDDRGIYKTAGDVPVLVSEAIGPLFRGDIPSTYSGQVINRSVTVHSMLWFDDRLYFAAATGSSSTADRLFVLDLTSGAWMVHSIAAAALGSFVVANGVPEIVFGLVGAQTIHRHGPAYTTDAGAAIAWNHKSGKYQLVPGKVAITQETSLFGTGSPTFQTVTELFSMPSATVTLGTSPTPARGWYQVDNEGRWWQHVLSGSGPADVASLSHIVTFARDEY